MDQKYLNISRNGAQAHKIGEHYAKNTGDERTEDNKTAEHHTRQKKQTREHSKATKRNNQTRIKKAKIKRKKVKKNLPHTPKNSYPKAKPLFSTKCTTNQSKTTNESPTPIFVLTQTFKN